MRTPEHAIDMDAVFSVEAWSAFAPGLDDDAAWSAWARAPWLPHGDDVPALAEMAPMKVGNYVVVSAGAACAEVT